MSTARASAPLDEAVWQAWVAKGRAQERRSDAAGSKAVKWASIAGLLVAAGLWFTACVACVALQSGRSGVQLFRRLAARRGGSKRYPIRRIAYRAPE
jgi:hypothetical protein